MLSWRGLDLTEFMSRMHLLIRTYLWAQTLVAMVLGIGLGVLLSPSGAALVRPGLALEIAHWIALPGKVFLALIQMVVIPLVVSSVAVGLNSTSDPSFLAKVGLRIAPYFVITTVIAVLIRIGVALAIEPGAFVDAYLVANAGQVPSSATAAVDATGTDPKSIPDSFVSLIPTHALEAVLAGDMLKIVIGAIIFGVALVSMPRDQATPLIKLL